MKQQPFIPAMANKVSEGRFKSEDVCFQYFAQQFLSVQDFKLTNNKKEKQNRGCHYKIHGIYIWTVCQQ